MREYGNPDESGGCVGGEANTAGIGASEPSDTLGMSGVLGLSIRQRCLEGDVVSESSSGRDERLIEMMGETGEWCLRESGNPGESGIGVGGSCTDGATDCKGIGIPKLSGTLGRSGMCIGRRCLEGGIVSESSNGRDERLDKLIGGAGEWGSRKSGMDGACG